MLAPKTWDALADKGGAMYAFLPSASARVRLKARGWFFLVTLCACTVQKDHDRAAWLHTGLVADRYGDLARNPELVVDQFDKMERDVFLYMRGTLPQFRRDLVLPFVGSSETAFANQKSSAVQLVGDPHIENIGTFRKRDGELVVEFNDFDSAVYGPFHTDVWRLALSWFAFGASAEFTRTKDQEWLGWSESAARGYAEEMLQLRAGRASDFESYARDNDVFADLLGEALEDGEDENLRARFTEVVDGRRRFSSAQPEELVPIGIGARNFVNGELLAWKARLPDEGRDLGKLLDLGRRFGAGIASLPQYRFYLLFEGASESLEDDLIIEWKETRDPCMIATGQLQPGRLLASNGERITLFQRRAHADPLSDRFAGWAGTRTWSFRSRENSGFHQGIDRSRMERRLQDGRWDSGDIEAAAYVSGQLLAHSHARAPGRDGVDVIEAIAGLLEGRSEEFALEARTQVVRMGPLLLDDFRLFALLREYHGADLGAAR